MKCIAAEKYSRLFISATGYQKLKKFLNWLITLSDVLDEYLCTLDLRPEAELLKASVLLEECTVRSVPMELSFVHLEKAWLLIVTGDELGPAKFTSVMPDSLKALFPTDSIVAGKYIFVRLWH